MNGVNMKKNKTNLYVILFFITVLGYFTFYLFTTQFECADETWNFQNIYKMYKGGLIYSDNNVIITPLFFVVGEWIFQLFGANLNIFRIYGVVIYFMKIFLLFLLFRKWKISPIFSITYLSLWLANETSYICNGANYNQLAIVFCLLGILWYFSHNGKRGYHALQGLMIFLIFFTKQNIGIYYAFGIVLFEGLENGVGKKFFQNQFAKLVSFLPCLLLSLGMMYVQGNLSDFWDLCFGSILEFGSNNHIFYWNNFLYIMIMGFLIGFSVYIIKLGNISQEIKTNAKFLLCLAIGLSFIMFPIINRYHLNMVILFYYLLFISIIDRIFVCEVLVNKSHQTIAIVICFCTMICLFAKVGYSYTTQYRKLEHFDKNHPFYNSRISQEKEERIDQMTDYIKTKQSEGTNVIVLSYEAVAYMLPLQINNREFDLPFMGNFGYRGVPKTIEKISNLKNMEILILTEEEDCFYQESNEIRAYIMNHLQKNGEILNYSIYINK